MTTHPAQDAHIVFDIILPLAFSPNQRHFFQQAASIIAPEIGLKERILSERLGEKEKETPSAIGNGIAVLNLQLSGLRKPFMLYARFKTPMQVETPDAKGVDIFCIILTPEREGVLHLPFIARLSRLLQDEQTATRLRLAVDEKSVRSVFEKTILQKQAA